ncbi:MAG: hypothetical protein WA432_05020 [Candidatus Babeliaceae bacterium]
MLKRILLTLLASTLVISSIQAVDPNQNKSAKSSWNWKQVAKNFGISGLGIACAIPLAAGSAVLAHASISCLTAKSTNIPIAIICGSAAIANFFALSYYLAEKCCGLFHNFFYGKKNVDKKLTELEIKRNFAEKILDDLEKEPSHPATFNYTLENPQERCNDMYKTLCKQLNTPEHRDQDIEDFFGNPQAITKINNFK